MKIKIKNLVTPEQYAQLKKEYAVLVNQRVIEELEIIISRLDSPWDRDDVRRRINELKQE